MAEVARLQVVIGARINGFNKEMGALQKNVKRTFASDNLGINKGALGVIAGVGVASVSYTHLTLPTIYSV